MGVLNVTPDSFFDGGLCDTVDKAVRRVIDMQKGGCDIVDIGGQSTRPGAQEISIKEELERVIPVIEALRMNGETRDHVIISIDTFQARVAQEAIEAGANMINDVTGGEYCGDEMMRVWKVSRVPVCIMHMRGNPRTMTTLNVYENKSVMKEVHKEMCLKVSEMIQYGIKRWNIIVDPGIGFAKNMDQNYELIQNLKMLVERGECIRMPVLLGVSRKGFIGKTVGDCDAQSEERKWGTAAACTAGIAGGCSILRVHDVKEMKSVALVADKCFK